VGKPLGILTASLAATLFSRGRLRPPVGFGSVLGAGAAAGVGFTVTLLIAALAFDRVELQQAKVGVLTAAVAATVLSWLTFRIRTRDSPPRRPRQLRHKVGSGRCTTCCSSIRTRCASRTLSRTPASWGST